jgi:hypothetical protein
MNNNLAFLLSEGFSIKTLDKMNESQLYVLSEKVKKSETKEQTTKTTTTTSYTKDQAKGKTFSSADDVSVSIKQDGSVDVTKEGEMTERAVSKQQQKLMGLALSVKRGDTPKSKVSQKVQDMSKKMSEKDLEDFASTKHKGLPKKKKKETKEDEVKHLEENIMKLLSNHFSPTLTKSELLKSINKNR